MVANSLRWTTRDLAAMPDDGGWKRYEIIDGELFVTRAPHIRHQGAAGKIHMRLEAWSESIFAILIPISSNQWVHSPHLIH